MSSVKEDIKENLRSSFEDNTGMLGQALKARREKQMRDKEVSTQLSKLAPKTNRLKSDNKALKKIEISSIQISENFQLINKWAGAQVTTHTETTEALAEQKKASQVAKLEEENLKIDVPDSNEDGSIFDSILDLFDKMGKKIKTKFPKIPKGKGNVLKKIAEFGIKNINTIAKVSVGVGALTYSGGLNTNEQEELDKRRNLPPKITQPPVDYTVPPPTGAIEVNAKTAAKAPALEAAKTVVAQPIPIAITPPPAPPPPAPPPAPTPVAAPKAAAGEPKKTVDVAKVAPSSKPPEVAASYAPTEQAAQSNAPSLTSVVKLATPSVSLQGIQNKFESTVATMANAFKTETGKPLLVTSGVRSNEEQKQLYDAKVASLGGNEAAAKKLVAEPMPPLGKGRGSMHLKGLAIDINSKGDGGLNALAGSRDKPTGWLEKFGLTRPVANEDWHVQLSGTPPVGDVGGVPGKDGKPIDPSTGNPMAVPTDPSTGKSLVDSSKTVAQLKQEQSQPGQTVVVVKNTTNVTEYSKKKQQQGQTTAAVG